jgi:hypothetical protein
MLRPGLRIIRQLQVLHMQQQRSPDRSLCRIPRLQQEFQIHISRARHLTEQFPADLHPAIRAVTMQPHAGYVIKIGFIEAHVFFSVAVVAGTIIRTCLDIAVGPADR